MRSSFVWLQRFASELGARVLYLPDAKVARILDKDRGNNPAQARHNRHDWRDAPFETDSRLGMHWPSKTVIAAKSYDRWWQILHELAHCVACKIHPDDCDETEFLGWEVAAFYQLGKATDFAAVQREWVDGMYDYGIGCTTTLGDLEPDARDNFFLEALQLALEQGLIDGDWNPKAIR